jgi:hypothetical protein
VTGQKFTCWSCSRIYVDIGRVPLACPRCGSQPNTPPPFPATLLEGFHWSFTQRMPTSEDEFRAALLAYNHDHGGHPVAELMSVMVPSWRVMVTHWRLANELTIEQTGFFSAAALLQAVHRKVSVRMRRMDHHFFEGFELKSAQPGLPPTYEMHLGS